MRTKCNILLIVLVIALSAHAEVKIISSKAWSPTITGTWIADEGLTHENTVYGDTYYNSKWQNMSKSSSIDKMSVYRYFYLRPDTKRNWSFSIPITNLNAEKGHAYSAKNSPNLKQNAEQIYWAIVVGYKENGIARTFRVWIKRSDIEYTYSGYEAYGSAQYIEYNTDNNGWKKSYTYYPDCSPNRAPSFSICTYSYGHTDIKWGQFSITDFPAYIEELTYIQLEVGTQAKIQVGKPYAYGEGVNERNIYTAADYMEQENYAMVRQKLYRADGNYYEKQAVNLAFAYLLLDETDKALELCNALIQYNGESVQYAYSWRGIIAESKGLKLAALDDYQKANDYDNYTRLYNEIYKPKAKQQNRQSNINNNSNKPALTK